MIFIQADSMAQRQDILLEKGWRFSLGMHPDAAGSTFDDSGWQKVTLPHDWVISGPFDKEIDKQSVAITQNGETKAIEKTGRTGALPYVGEGWYRKNISLPGNHTEQTFLLQFDGAMSESCVFVNGQLAGGDNYGYSYFYLDITKFVISGNNVISVRLFNRPKSSRWYPGAGIYRNVHLIIKNEKSIDQWGVNITTPVVTSSFAKVKIRTEFHGEQLRLVPRVLNAEQQLVGADTAAVAFGNEFEQNIILHKPQLWSPDRPYPYTAETNLYRGNELVDHLVTRFGVRTINYSAEKQGIESI